MTEVFMTVDGANADPAPKLYAIRFHMMSGKTKDMHIDEFDARGKRNELWNAKGVYNAVSRNLEEYHKYISKNDNVPSQNFIVYEDAIEFLELIEREREPDQE